MNAPCRRSHQATLSVWRTMPDLEGVMPFLHRWRLQQKSEKIKILTAYKIFIFDLRMVTSPKKNPHLKRLYEATGFHC